MRHRRGITAVGPHGGAHKGLTTRRVTCLLVCAFAACVQMKDTPLLRAAHNGHLQTVMFLVEQGAALNAVDLVRRVCSPCSSGRW